MRRAKVLLTLPLITLLVSLFLLVLGGSGSGVSRVWG